MINVTGHKNNIEELGFSLTMKIGVEKEDLQNAIIDLTELRKVKLNTSLSYEIMRVIEFLEKKLIKIKKWYNTNNEYEILDATGNHWSKGIGGFNYKNPNQIGDYNCYVVKYKSDDYFAIIRKVNKGEIK